MPNTEYGWYTFNGLNSMKLETDICCQFLQLICSGTENRIQNPESRIQNLEFRIQNSDVPTVPTTHLHWYRKQKTETIASISDSQPVLTPQTPESLCSDHCICASKWERGLKEITFPLSRPTTLRSSEQQCNPMSRSSRLAESSFE